MYGAAPALRRVRLQSVQPSPSQQGYDDGRWRSSIESKLDKSLDLLNKLDTNYQTMNLRVTTLENAPKEAQARWNLYMLGGGCLYMLLSVSVTGLGVLISYLVSHH